MTDYVAANGMANTMGGPHGRAALYDSVVDTTFVAYGGPATKPHIYSYKHTPGYWEAPVKISDTDPDGPSDGHGVPTLALDEDGYLHVFWGSHNTNQAWAISTNQHDALGGFVEQTQISSVSSTYPNPVYTNGKRYVFLRHEVNGATHKVFGYLKWTGSAWGSFVEVCDYGGTTGWNNPSDFAISADGTKIYVGGYKRIASGGDASDPWILVLDTADDSITNVAGTSLTTPADETEIDSKIRIEDTTRPGPRLVVGLDPSDVPHAVYVKEVAGPTYEYRHAVWNGSSWDISTIATFALTAGADAGAELIVNSSSSADAFLVNVSQQVERWSWNGSAWSLAETITSVGAYRNIKRVENGKAELTMFFPQQDSTDFTNADLRVYGWGSSGFLGTGTH